MGNGVYVFDCIAGVGGRACKRRYDINFFEPLVRILISNNYREYMDL